MSSEQTKYNLQLFTNHYKMVPIICGLDMDQAINICLSIYSKYK